VRVEPVPGRNLLVNGSFEDGPENEGWTAVKPGATQMPGWKLVGAEVGFASSLWLAADGRRSLFFPSVPDKGRLQQTFKTKKGQRYRVTFSLSGNPNGGWWSNAEFARTRLAVSAAGQSQEFAFDSAGKSPSDMGWVTKTWEFDATSDRTTLEFSTLDTNRGYWVAPALDNVRVYAAR
jgi:choice-of-anchor C domain-containing protein